MKRLMALNQSGRGMELGLGRMLRFAKQLELFQEGKSKFVHVAGTNGKGSVCHKIGVALANRMTKVGMFTSPHVGTYRERIRVNGEMVTETECEGYLDAVERAEKELGESPTYFEALTLLAFLHFKHQGVDASIIETGLGGLEDATNIIPNPQVCVVTSIGYDHQHILGNSLEEIAAAKAGIFKPGCHAVIGPNAVPYSVFKTYSEKVNVASFTIVQKEEDASDSIDKENSLVALEAVRKFGFADVQLSEVLGKRPSGRFELLLENRTVLDGAHNPQAFQGLRTDLESTFPDPEIRFHFVIAMSGNKDIKSNLRHLLVENHRVASIHLARSENLQRSADLASLSSAVADMNLQTNTTVHDTVMEAYNLASRDTLRQPKAVIVVCGSFNAIGGVRKYILQNTADLDEINMNENKV